MAKIVPTSNISNEMRGLVTQESEWSPAPITNKYFVSIATSESPEWPAFQKLNRVESDVKVIEEFFEGEGYKFPLREKIPINATSNIVISELGNWLAEADGLTESCMLVLYFAGHGYKSGFNELCFITFDAKNGQPETTIEVYGLVKLILNRKHAPKSLLIIIDVCYAGQGAEDITEIFSKIKSTQNYQGCGIHIIVSAGPDNPARDGAFINAFIKALKSDIWLEYSETHVDLKKLEVKINDEIKNLPQKAIYTNPVGGILPQQFIRNPKFTPSFDKKRESDLLHWQEKVLDKSNSEVVFTGRSRALIEINEWLMAEKTDKKPRFVTGRPGAGKSAVLGKVVLAANGIVQDASIHISKSQKIVGIFAREEKKESILTTLNIRLGFSANTTNELRTSLNGLTHPIGIIIDSLDEAIYPRTIVNDFLAELAEHPKVRLVVGGRDIHVAEWKFPPKVIDLDNDNYFEESDLKNYILARLTKSPESRVYSQADHYPIAEKLANFISRKAERNFLYAYLVSNWFISNDEPVNTNLPNWEREIDLPDHIDEVFAKDLDRLGENRSRFLDLLIPLAYAKGRGLPQRKIWYKIANEIADKEYRNNDINDLKSRAGYYITEDKENEETVFRLFHQSLVNYLQNYAADFVDPKDVANALRDLAGPNWHGMRPEHGKYNPYFRFYIPAHGAESGLLDTWIQDVDFLLAVSPAIVRPYLNKLRTQESRLIGIAYRRVIQPYTETVSARDLHIQALQYGIQTLDKNLRQYKNNYSAFANWGVWFPSLPFTRIGKTKATISKILVDVDQVGVPFSVCVLSDGSVQVLNCADGTTRWFISADSNQNSGKNMLERTHLALAKNGYQYIIVVGWSPNIIQLFDLSDGTDLGTFDHKSIGEITCMQTANRNGESILFIATDLSEIRCYSLPGLRSINIDDSKINDIKGKILSMAILIYEKESILVSGYNSYSKSDPFKVYDLIKLLDLKTMKPIWVPKLDRLSFIKTILTFQLDRSQWIVAHRGYSELILLDYFTKKSMIIHEIFASHMIDLIDCYVEKQKVYIIGKSYKKLFVIELIATQDQIGNPFNYIVYPFSFNLPSHIYSRIIFIDNFPVLICASEQEIRGWDVKTMVQEPIKISFSEELIRSEGEFRTMCVVDGKIITYNFPGGYLCCWEMPGRLLWKSEHRYILKTMHPTVLNDKSVLVLGLEEYIGILSVETGKLIGDLFEIGGKMFDVDFQWYNGEPLLFVSSEFSNCKFDDLSKLNAIRVWNILTWNEIDTRIIFRHFSEFLFTIYDDRPNISVQVLEWKNSLWLIFANDRNRIKILNYSQIIEENINNKAYNIGLGYAYQGNNIQLCPLIINDNPCLLTGTSNILTLRELLAFNNIIKECEVSGDITTLHWHRTDFVYFFIVGTDNGMLTFLDKNLRLLDSINLEYSINTVSYYSDNQLAICTEEGFVVLDVDWARIAGSGN